MTVTNNSAVNSPSVNTQPVANTGMPDSVLFDLLGASQSDEINPVLDDVSKGDKDSARGDLSNDDIVSRDEYVIEELDLLIARANPNSRFAIALAKKKDFVISNEIKEFVRSRA